MTFLTYAEGGIQRSMLLMLLLLLPDSASSSADGSGGGADDDDDGSFCGKLRGASGTVMLY